MTTPTLVFLDTETTGLDPDRCEIWEIGAILRLPGEADVEYCWQIRPTLVGAEPTGLRIGRYYQRCLIAAYQPGFARRIGPEQYEATTAGEVAAELAVLLDGAYLVGAVPWFDERFLQRFLAQHNQAATNHYHLIDVETLAAARIGMRPPWGFDDILDRFGLKYDEADRHTALGDARMVRDLYDLILPDESEERP